MSRKLAKSTVEKFSRKLDDEEARLTDLIEELDHEREEVRLSETSSERSPDPNTAEGGSMAFELEKELSVAQNAADLLEKVRHARTRVADGSYGVCEVCGQDIPVARLDALPYATTCVSCASKR